MAKQPTVSVHIDDKQFQDFTKRFDTLSRRIQALTNSFNQVAGAVNKTNQSAKQLQSTLSSINQFLTGIGNKTKTVTENIGKWAALIGGTVMMLGTGAGLFGVDRLSRIATDSRKQALALGLGGNVAGMQASQIAFQGTPGGSGFLSNITAGLYGDVDKKRAINRLGVPYDTKMDTAEASRVVLDNLQKQMKNVDPRYMMQWAKSMGYDQLFSEDFLVAHAANPKLFDIEREEQAKRPAPVSEQAQINWTRFSMAIDRFTTSLENRLTDKFSNVAVALTHLSDALMKAVTTFLNWPIVQETLDKIAKWLDNFAKDVGSDEFQKKLQDFGKWLSEEMPTKFKEWEKTFSDLMDIIGSVVRAILALYNLKPAGAVSGPDVSGLTGQVLPPPISTDPPNTGGFTPSSGNTGGGIGHASLGGGPSYASAAGRSMFASNTVGPGGNKIFPGGTRTAVNTYGSPGVGGNSTANFKTATNQFVPRQEDQGNSLLQTASLLSSDFGGQRGRRGSNDFQINPRSVIVARDIPTSNISLTGIGLVSSV